MKKNIIYNEKAEITLKKLPVDVIDLTVTSPPYDNLRSYNVLRICAVADLEHKTINLQ